MIVKNIHHAMNVTLSEAEHFAIRCGNNHAFQLQDILCIVIVTDIIPAARKYLIQTFILNNYILLPSHRISKCFYWDCPSNIK